MNVSVVESCLENRVGTRTNVFLGIPQTRCVVTVKFLIRREQISWELIDVMNFGRRYVY